MTLRHLAYLVTAAILFMDIGQGTAAAQSSSGRQAIQVTHVPEAVRSGSATALNALNNQQHLTLYLTLPTRDPAGLQQLLRDLSDRSSPRYRHFLSFTEFANRYGPTAQDYNAVAAWAQANGLNVTGTAASRRFVTVEAPVETINRVFQVRMTEYRHPGEARPFYAPDREPTTAGLTVPLLEVANMSDFFTHHPRQSSGGSGLDGSYLPGDIRRAYYGNGPLTGAGQRVALIEFSGYSAADWQSFLSQTGTSTAVPITKVPVPGNYNDGCTNTTPCANDGEAISDIVLVIGMAPGLSELRVYEATDATGELPMLEQILSDGSCKIVSISWSFGGSQSSDDSEIQQLEAQGVSVLHSSGDDGSLTSGNADWFDVDPAVTQVGGTQLTTSNGAWSSEVAWSGSGGGHLSLSSATIASYQQLPGVINSSNGGSTQYRNTPDVALVASNVMTWSNSDALNPFGAGTSFSAPAFAGFLALVNQQSQANGHSTVGAVNPQLYSIGVAKPGAYHDITSGSNGNFNAVTGYDLVTGWGSPAGLMLIDQLAGVPRGIAALTPILDLLQN